MASPGAVQCTTCAAVHGGPVSPDSLSRVPSSTQRSLEGVSTDLHGGMAWLQGACELLGRGHSFVYRCVLLGNKTVHVSQTLESQPSSRLRLGPVTAREAVDRSAARFPVLTWITAHASLLHGSRGKGFTLPPEHSRPFHPHMWECVPAAFTAQRDRPLSPSAPGWNTAWGS